MLFLLLKTLALQALNYLRDKFDRLTIFYFALIGLMVLYLVGRSPADIGFRLQELNTATFAQRWFGIFCGLLPFYYLFAEASAYHSARSSAANRLLLGLPVPTKTLTDFALLTTLFKMISPLLLLALPFLFGHTDAGQRAVYFAAAFAIIIWLAQAAWLQATHLRQFWSGNRGKLALWLPIETGLLAGLYWLANNVELQLTLRAQFGSSFTAGVLAAVCVFSYFAIVRFYPMQLRERVSGAKASHHSDSLLPKIAGHSILITLMGQDFLFISKKKKSILLLQAVGAVIALMVSLHSEASMGAVIFIQGIWSFFLMNALSILFKRDAETFTLLRSLHISAGQIWLARCFFAAAMLAMPFVAPYATALFQNPALAQFGIASLALSLIPGIIALVFTIAGYGTFPHVNFGANMMNFTLLFMLLFWFYLPFGSLLILLVLLFSIRKSLRNLKMVEIS